MAKEHKPMQLSTWTWGWWRQQEWPGHDCCGHVRLYKGIGIAGYITVINQLRRFRCRHRLWLSWVSDSPIGVPAGKVLQHAKRMVTALFAKHAPLIFKFGYTHNPRWRWENKLYGYKLDKAHKWSKLLVLYECTEVSGPAMLEAMLNELYGGTLIELKKIVCDIICMYAIHMLCIFFLLYVFFLHYSASPWSAHHFPQVVLDAKTSGLAATVWWCHRSCNPQISTGAAPILYIGLSSTHQRPRQYGLDHVQSDWI